MKKFPIAERFTSLQGEGLYTGTLMHFVRFAGCSVGKPIRDPQEREDFSRAEGLYVLPIYREKCTTYDGREFLCDTDFRTKEALTMAEILAGVPKGVERLCFTGGEPLNQPLKEFLSWIGLETKYKVHIETSGTVSLTEMWPEYCPADSNETNGASWLWITVSPKTGVLSKMIGLANEIKLLVDENFDIKKVPEDIKDHRLVWVQPINTEFTVNRKNLEKCIQLLHEYPNWRMSTQMHKIWNVR